MFDYIPPIFSSQTHTQKHNGDDTHQSFRCEVDLTRYPSRLTFTVYEFRLAVSLQDM